MNIKEKQYRRMRRHKRVRSRVVGTAERPRLNVFRSNKHIYAQLVDDSAGKIMASVSDHGFKEKGKGVENSKQVGAQLAQAIMKNGVEKVVFDRSGYSYHGNVKAVADGAREAGLQF